MSPAGSEGGGGLNERSGSSILKADIGTLAARGTTLWSNWLKHVGTATFPWWFKDLIDPRSHAVIVGLHQVFPDKKMFKRGFEESFFFSPHLLTILKSCLYAKLTAFSSIPKALTGRCIDLFWHKNESGLSTTQTYIYTNILLTPTIFNSIPLKIC